MGWSRRGAGSPGGPRGRRRAAQASPRGASGLATGGSAGRVPWQENAGRSPEPRPLRGQRAVSRGRGQTSGAGPDLGGRGRSRGGRGLSASRRVQAAEAGVSGPPGKGTGTPTREGYRLRPPGSRFGYLAPDPWPDQRRVRCGRGMGADRRGGDADAGWSAGNFRTGTPSLTIQALALPGVQWARRSPAQTRPLTCGLEPGCLEGGVLSEVGLQRHVAAALQPRGARGPRSHRTQGHVVGAFLVWKEEMRLGSLTGRHPAPLCSPLPEGN